MIIARLSNDTWIIIHAFYYRQSSNVALQAFAFIRYPILRTRADASTKTPPGGGRKGRLRPLLEM